jgi:hypothetical protein
VKATRGGETIVKLFLRGIFDILVTLLVAGIFGALLIAVSNIAEGAAPVPGAVGRSSGHAPEALALPWATGVQGWTSVSFWAEGRNHFLPDPRSGRSSKPTCLILYSIAL